MTDDQMSVRPVNDDDLERYENWAALREPHILAGEVNWPMMVLSLVAEVRRLKSDAGKGNVWHGMRSAPKGDLFWATDCFGDLYLALWLDLEKSADFYDRHGHQLLEATHWADFDAITSAPDILSNISEIDPGSSCHYLVSEAFIKAAKKKLNQIDRERIA